MTIEKQFSKAVMWMATGSWIEQTFNILFFVVLARILGAEAFGLATMAVAFVIFAESLVRESLSEYLISRDDLDDAHMNAAFWLLFGLGGLLTLGIILFAGLIADLYGEAIVETLLIAFSPTIFLVATNAVPVAILRRNMEFKILSLRAIAGVVIGGIVGLTMALNGFGVWSLVAQQVTLIAVNAVAAWAYAGWCPRFNISRSHLREVSGFGRTMLGLRLAELIATQTPLVLIGATLGATALGFFSISWRLIEVGSFLIVTPLRMASQSTFAIINREGGRATTLLTDIVRVSSLVAVPAFLGLALVSTPFVLTMFGPDWEPAGPALAMLSLVGLYFCIERVQQSFCLAAGKVGALTALAWAEVALGIILILIATQWGLAAVAAAFAARYYLLWPFRFRIVAEIGQTTSAELTTHLVRPAILGIAMALLIWVVYSVLPDGSPLVQLIVGVTTGLIFFALGTLFFMRDRIALLKTYIAK